MFLKTIFFLFLIPLCFFIILNLGLPIIFDLIILLCFIFLFLKDIKLFIIYNFLILICIISTSIFFSFTNFEKNKNLLGHKNFINNDKYLSNINEEIFIPPGDLIALDTCNDHKTFEFNKKQLFITDELGFRNKNFQVKKSDFILIGDSIILSSRLDQKNILSELLNNNSHSKTFSNLSFSGIGPKIYEKIINDHLAFFKDEVKIYIFYFEGNDFSINKKNEEFNWYGHKMSKFKYKLRFGYERIERNKDKILTNTFFYKNHLYKKIRPHSQRSYKKFLSIWTNSCLVDWKEINDLKIGFLYKYFEINEYFTHIIKNQNILSKIDKIFFVPTKLSVYENYLINDISKINREKKISYLKKNYEPLNIEVVDLTKIFQENAKKFLNENKLLYFPDDTHLNELGNQVLSNYIIQLK